MRKLSRRNNPNKPYFVWMKEQILLLAKTWCKLNTYSIKLGAHGEDNSKAMKCVEKRIYLLTGRSYQHVDMICNWYWNVHYQHNTNLEEWIDFWFFNILTLRK